MLPKCRGSLPDAKTVANQLLSEQFDTVDTSLIGHCADCRECEAATSYLPAARIAGLRQLGDEARRIGVNIAKLPELFADDTTIREVMAYCRAMLFSMPRLLEL